MALQHSPSVVTSGLVLCLDAANSRSYPGSGTVWTDVSGNGNTGTLTNGPTYNSTNLGSIVFDGVDDKVITTLSPLYNSTTWEAWVYCTANVSSYNMFMGDWLPYFGFYGGNSLYFSNIMGGAQQTIQTTSDLSLNTWYQAVFTTAFNGTNTTASIYTNSILTASNLQTGAQGGPGGTFTVGDGNNSTWYPFQGKVSGVKIYNRALSAAEVTQNFNALRGRYGI